jgi:CRISPR-associated protein (TIGR02710 family)
MTMPRLAALPPDLVDLQRRWLTLGRKEQDELYASEFAPRFAPLFAELPLHGAPGPLARPRALVSVLGLSWQPVALMAAWCKPQRMLVLGTEDSFRLTPGGEGVLSLIARIAGLSREAIEPIRIGDPGEADIYRAVRDFLRRPGVHAREAFVDPTGGKKSMSASAALAGFLAGAPLVYVDYGEYHGPNRIPVAGTEYPRLLANPLEVMGDLEMRDIFHAFNRSDFGEAERLALRLAERLYEPREAECLAKLARGYGAWDRFDFASARQALGAALNELDRFATQGGWTWASHVRAALAANLPALDALEKVQKKPASLDEGAPLLVWYLAAATRLLDAGKSSLAVLLIYAAVERYVGLCLWVDFHLDDEKPDYSLVADRLDRAKYDEAGRRLFGKDYKPRELDGPLMFSNGAQLLAALAPTRLDMNHLGPLKGLSSIRNKCEYEHGFLPKAPAVNDAEHHLNKVIEIVAQSCGDEREFRRRMEECRFATLEPARPG